MGIKKAIGRSEKVDFSELGALHTPARIDTGAKTSAIWVTSAKEVDGGLEAVFFGTGSEWFTGKPVLFPTYAEVVVASSNGIAEERYKVRLLVSIAGKRIRAWFTLADRSAQAYPVLIGRNVLRGKFLVDVSQSNGSFQEAERHRTKVLREQITKEV